MKKNLWLLLSLNSKIQFCKKQIKIIEKCPLSIKNQNAASIFKPILLT